MRKYNLLTEWLLSKGYTAENYPAEMVHIAHGYPKSDDLLDRLIKPGKG